MTTNISFKNVKLLFRDSLIIAFITIVLLVLLEVLAGYGLRVTHSHVPKPISALSDDQIRALYNSEDVEYYKSVISEGWGIGYSDYYEPFVEFKMKPYDGTHVTIKSLGYRSNYKGMPPPSNEHFTVFVFGGSTTLGLGVADSETIPAYMERELRARYREDVRVYNFGVSAYFSTQERILFESLVNRGITPNVVVFVDGLNDFYFADVPDRSYWSDRILEQLTDSGQSTIWNYIQLNSNIMRLFDVLLGGGDIQSTTGRHLKDISDVDRVINRLDSNRRMLYGICNELDISVFFVQQPVPTYGYDNNLRPVKYPKSQLIFHTNSGIGYKRMLERKQKGEVFVKNVLWLQDLAIKENQYIDTVHYSPSYSKAIANRIVDGLIRDFEVVSQ